MKHHSRWVRNVIGLAAIAALAALLLLAYFRENRSAQAGRTQAGHSGSIFFDSDLIYDGTGSLDLMYGVTTDDGEGNSANDRVAVIITADGTLANKTVRYTFTDAAGNTITQKRQLLLNRYRGPELTVGNSLSLDAEDLPDLITVLQSKGLLKADNGYGKDITDTVTCLRVHKGATKYEMTFTVTNEFSDTLTVTRIAQISGKVNDPVLALKQEELTVRKGTYFDPAEWIKSAKDGGASVSFDEIEVHSPVNVDAPGKYTVTYRLYNAERTAMTEQTMTVIVK